MRDAPLPEARAFLRWLFATGAFAAGTATGLYLPVLVGKALNLVRPGSGAPGWGGSYEDVMFYWLVTVPGCAILFGWLAWRGSAPRAPEAGQDEQLRDRPH